ncbi:hypothetical protein BJ166DRAFT_538270, partial [Pestalotiopsis sp. NC0098]
MHILSRPPSFPPLRSLRPLSRSVFLLVLFSVVLLFVPSSLSSVGSQDYLNHYLRTDDTKVLGRDVAPSSTFRSV